MSKKPRRIYLESITQPNFFGKLDYLPLDPLDNLNVERLRSYTQIENVIFKSKTDFSQALMIAKFASEAWSHDGFNSNPKKQDALTILKLADKGATFACVQFASVFVQLCQSVGIPARVLEVRTKHPDLGTSGHGHITAEYFDNQLCKWVWVDPQICAYAVKNKVPLSYNEYAELSATGKNPKVQFTKRTMTYIKNDKRHLKVLNNFVKRYIWSAHIGGLKSFYTKQTHLKNIGCKREGVLPTITFQGFADRSPFYVSRNVFDAPLNVCYMRLETTPPRKMKRWNNVKDYKETAHMNYATSEITLHLTHNMPWFKEYVVLINGKKRVSRIDKIKFKLNSGVNTVQVRTRNEYERLGPLSEVKIRYDNKYKDVKNFW